MDDEISGFLLMVDGVLKENQTRDEWLNALQERMETTIPYITSDEVAFRMQHPRMDDFPESIETFSNLARQQAWKSLSSFKVEVEFIYHPPMWEDHDN